MSNEQSILTNGMTENWNIGLRKSISALSVAPTFHYSKIIFIGI
jgi:hypothetical protein